MVKFKVCKIMKNRFLSFIVAVMTAVISSVAYASNGSEATVYLTSGNVLHGQVSEENGRVTMITASGQIYSWLKSEVRRIDYSGAAPAVPPTGKNKPVEGFYQDAMSRDSGFWWGVESVTGYACNLYDTNLGFEEIDAVAGYRFNSYVLIGAGLGARWYWDDRVRYRNSAWSMPIFFNVRGSMIPHAYRTVVPVYSLDIGGSIRDGFMLRPAIGMRIGGLRSAFNILLAYTGQNNVIATCLTDGSIGRRNKFTSFLTLKLGYEF